jgi:hypothetical protein
VFGDALAIPAVVTAMMGLCTLLFTGVLNWRDCLTYTAAWDTLFWFASEGQSTCYEAMLPRHALPKLLLAAQPHS